MSKTSLTLLVVLSVAFASAQTEQRLTTQNQQQTQQAAVSAGQSQEQAAAKPADSDEQQPAERKTHFHLGTVTLGVGYTYFGHAFIPPYSPYYYPYGYSVGLFYMPFLADPFYGPFYYPYGYDLKYALGKGEVKLSSLGPNKNASVYIDNAYAGRAGKLKQMWLDPGAYDLALKTDDGRSFKKRIYVLSGKTLKLAPEFRRDSSVQPEEKK